MKTGEIKYNNGRGAFCCPDCHKIIFWGWPKADYYFCENCKTHVNNPDPHGS